MPDAHPAALCSAWGTVQPALHEELYTAILKVSSCVAARRARLSPSLITGSMHEPACCCRQGCRYLGQRPQPNASDSRDPSEYKRTRSSDPRTGYGPAAQCRGLITCTAPASPHLVLYCRHCASLYRYRSPCMPWPATGTTTSEGTTNSFSMTTSALRRLTMPPACPSPCMWFTTHGTPVR